MYGSFDESAQSTWDFTRCQRPDGSFYGTAGKCRKGDETGAKEIAAPKAKKAAKKKPAAKKKVPAAAKPKMKAKAKAALEKATPEQLEKLKSHPKVTPAQKKVLDKAIAEKTGKAVPKAKETDDQKLERLNKERKSILDNYNRLDDERRNTWNLPENDPKRVKAEAAFDKATDDFKRIKKEIEEIENKKAAAAKPDKVSALEAKKKAAFEAYKALPEGPEKVKAKAAYKKADDAYWKAKEEAGKPADKKAAEKELSKLEKQQTKILNDFSKGRSKYDSMPDGPEKDKFGAQLEAMAKTYKENKEKITELKNKGAQSKEMDKDDLVDRDEERNRRGKIYREAQNNTNLNEKQRAAIRDYTDEGGERPYSDLNACLRQPATCDKENRGWTRQHTKELDSALKALPKNDNAEPFWRGTRADSGQALALYQALENAKPGMRMKDPAFGSYSYDESTARGFTSRTTKSILFVSRSKQLTPIDTFSEITIEREALLPRGTEQTVRSVRKDGEMLIVEID
jgi:hypothetical protein